MAGENVHVPDLLLVYGPIRSHLGFPAWRLRYTEIVHMGTLKYMRYGSLLKAIHKFTGVHQNYGKSLISHYFICSSHTHSLDTKVSTSELD
jgi:ditrans,polycis-polyprenyl diphosphate synthase